jgi:hypothetical protein
MPLTGADTASTLIVAKLGMEYCGVPRHFEGALVGVKIDCVSASTRCLSAY